MTPRRHSRDRSMISSYAILYLSLLSTTHSSMLLLSCIAARTNIYIWVRRRRLNRRDGRWISSLQQTTASQTVVAGVHYCTASVQCADKAEQYQQQQPLLSYAQQQQTVMHRNTSIYHIPFIYFLCNLQILISKH